MGFCEKIRVDRVIADEIFYVQDVETDIDIGEIAVPEGSILQGNVTVTVLECEPIIDFEANTLSALVTFMIQKELLITTQEPVVQQFTLEFGFRIQEPLTFRKVFPLQLQEIDPDLLQDLRCYVVNVQGTDIVNLEPGEIGEATFDETLTIQIKLKLVQERQLIFALCPQTHQVDVTVQEVDNNNNDNVGG